MLVVHAGGSLESEPTRWWDNPLVWLDDETALDTPGTIYLVDGLVGARNFAITADRVALVVLPELTALDPENDAPFVEATGVSHAWLEGTFGIDGESSRWRWSDVAFSVMDHVRIVDFDLQEGTQ